MNLVISSVKSFFFNVELHKTVQFLQLWKIVKVLIRFSEIASALIWW